MLQVKNTSSGVMLLVKNPESIRDSGVKNRIPLYLPLLKNLLNQPDSIQAPKLQVKNTSSGTNPPDLIYP
jgi:hypothetical protein